MESKGFLYQNGKAFVKYRVKNTLLFLHIYKDGIELTLGLLYKRDFTLEKQIPRNSVSFIPPFPSIELK